MTGTASDPGKGMNSMKKILIVVDMQNDFVDGALGTKEAALTAMRMCRIHVHYRGKTA